ncbi:putrescine aminotransferase [Clostridium algifaecis]|uniref:Putrescine aminotransferase n=1 Tax=Clostridium algifaecis TaxID=1472040 RepID=A0ABS4KS81_9CLOT|nr:aminotransferase class III-fold pyridoxal phosphate-dependent enzyme [Clostridium algifaecis]MBP2032894.1 putrescine aminotransferase [Clostridium algifaecis]
MYNKTEIIKDLDRIIGYIESTGELDKKDRELITSETVDNIRNYLNKGWIDIRKSTDSEDGREEAEPVIEWSDGGEYFYDLNGERYIDCLGGYGVFTPGHRNPEITKYVKLQLSRLGLHSQELLEPLRAYLAKTFELITPGDLQYAFFTNGGAEAIEMSLKLARLYTGKKWYISTLNAFHGKSNGALSATGKGFTRKAFLPMVQQTFHVEYGNAEETRTAIRNLTHVGEEVAAVIVEPIQGEGGVIIPPKGYLKELREICDEYGALLIFDEIQTGMGRTGTLWRCEAEGVVPDILAFGKAIGGGIIPMTGIVAKPKLWTQPLIENPNLLGSPTFGGNPVACSAALATIKYTLENDIPGMCKKKGETILKELKKLKLDFPKVLKDVRGAGLLIAMEFDDSKIGYYVAKKLFENKILTAGTEINAKVIRIEPPACISYESIGILLNTLKGVLQETEIEFKLADFAAAAIE